MTQTVTLSKVYDEIKRIEKNMVTKEEISKFLDTLEIMTNPKTMEQVRRSEQDIKEGRIKEINSIRDI